MDKTAVVGQGVCRVSGLRAPAMGYTVQTRVALARQVFSRPRLLLGWFTGSMWLVGRGSGSEGEWESQAGSVCAAKSKKR